MNYHKEKTKGGCSIYAVILLINLVFGGWSIDYILGWFAKEIPFVADMCIGLFLGELTIPVAIVVWILQLCGVF